MKITRVCSILSLIFLAFACETPMLIEPEDVPRGIYVTFDPINTNMNSEDIEGTPFAGTFDAPSDNVASHAISVKRIYDMGASETEYVDLLTITEFPYEFSISGSELADLFGIPVEESFANFYVFNGVATGNNGETADFSNLHNDLIGSPEQLQGFRLQGAVVCPSDPNVIVGTYSSLTSGEFPGFDPFTDFAYTVSITADEEEGFYTLSDFSFGTYDFLYGPWYGGGDLPATIQDVCGTFFITGTQDPWGETVSGDFTFNPDGTITVVGGTTFGETWTAVLTKQ